MPKVRIEIVKEYLEKTKKLEYVSKRNQHLLDKFYKSLVAEGLSSRRIYKLLCHLKFCVKFFRKDMDKITPNDIVSFSAHLNERNLQLWTKQNYGHALDKFFKLHFGDESRIYIKLKKQLRILKKKPKFEKKTDILTPEDIDKMVKAENLFMYKAIYRFMFESGARFGEFIELKWRDIEYMPDGTVQVSLCEGKTGHRVIPLVNSKPLLKLWQESTPYTSPHDYLWTVNNGKSPISHSTLRKRLDMIVEKIGLDKRVNPHSFRKASATYLSQFLTEAQMNEYFGWVQGSGQARVYIHLSRKNIRNAIRKIHSLGNDGEDTLEMEKKSVQCECGTVNDIVFTKCISCGNPLNLQERFIKDMERRVADQIMNEIFYNDPAVRKSVERAKEMLRKNIDLGKLLKKH